MFSSPYVFNYILRPTVPPHYIWILQAASGVSSSYDVLVDLFECLGNFLQRIRIYSDLLTPAMTEISVKIMVELLSVLALATKQIKQGRFSKWIRLFDMGRPNATSCREIREETAGRKRDRRRATQAGPPHTRG